VAAHLTLIPTLGKPLESAAGKEFILGESPISLAPQEVGGMVAHAGYRLRLPASASLHWPALPHNPYRKDGRATAGEGRIEIRLPFTETCRRHEVLVEVGK
jgi:hypothetical protein